jgi:hypothetical protein
MKKVLNITQNIVESVLQATVLTLIVLGFMMAMTSCSGQKQYAKKKNDWMTKKKYDTAKHNKKCRSYTCYEW